jgi:hypothetical protein
MIVKPTATKEGGLRIQNGQCFFKPLVSQDTGLRGASMKCEVHEQMLRPSQTAGVDADRYEPLSTVIRIN